VPEVPFGIHESYWKALLISFTIVLMVVTIISLMAGASPNAVGSLYVIPAILFAYFYRRRGVLIAYLLAMFYFAAVVLFRYPAADEIVTAAIRSGLLIAIALIVSFLTAHLIREKRKYHAIFDNTENGVLIVRLTDHCIIEMNQRFASSLGLPRTAIEGQGLESFITDPAPLIRHLADSKDWAVADLDVAHVTFVRRNGPNAALARAYPAFRAPVAERILAGWLAANGHPPAKPALTRSGGPIRSAGAWSVANTGHRLLGWLVHAPLILSGPDKALRATVSIGCTRPLSKTGSRPKPAMSNPFLGLGACSPAKNQAASTARQIQGSHFFIGVSPFGRQWVSQLRRARCLSGGQIEPDALRIEQAGPR